MPSDRTPPGDSNEQAPEVVLAGGRYVGWRKIASGSQADTLEAVDRQSGRAVAIKRFSVGHAQSWKDVELAEREAKVLASLSHRDLPAYLDHFEEDGALYLVMELVEGQSLISLMRKGQRLSHEQLTDLIRSLADILDYLHSRVPPVIHRDIKPGNVILRPDGGFSLVDFGSVRDGLKPEGGSTVVGTFGYMAPEQFQGRALPASDVYAVGALTLTLLTGKSPEQLPHRGLGIDVAASIGGTVPDGWVDAVERMLDINPDHRARSLRPILDLMEGRTRVAQTAAKRRDTVKETTSDESTDIAEPDGAFTVMVGSGFGLLPWAMLTIARVVLFVVLGVFVPTLLSVLSILFGPRLRVAAQRVSHAGLRARTRLSTVAGHLRRAEPFILQGKHYRHRRSSHWRHPEREPPWRVQSWSHHGRDDFPGFQPNSESPERTESDTPASFRRGGSLFSDDAHRPHEGSAKKRKAPSQ